MTPRKPQPRSPRTRADGKGGHLDRQLRGTPEPMADRCAAKIKRTNPPRYCTQHKGKGTDHVGTGRCWLHGGRSLKGLAHPNAGDLSRSKYGHLLPAGGLLEGYEAALKDPNLRTVREHVALSEGLIAEELGRVGSGASAQAWTEAGDLTAQLDAAFSRHDAATVGRLWPSLRDLLKRGADSQAARARVADLLELGAKMRGLEAKLHERERRMISIEQMVGYVRLLGAAIERRISDLDVRRQLMQDLMAIAEGRRLMPLAPAPEVSVPAEPVPAPG